MKTQRIAKEAKEKAESKRGIDGMVEDVSLQAESNISELAQGKKIVTDFSCTVTISRLSTTGTESE